MCIQMKYSVTDLRVCIPACFLLGKYVLDVIKTII